MTYLEFETLHIKLVKSIQNVTHLIMYTKEKRKNHKCVFNYKIMLWFICLG